MNEESCILRLEIVACVSFFPAGLGAPQSCVVLEAVVYSSYKTSSASVYICFKCVCEFLLSDVVASDFTYGSLVNK